MKFFYKIYSHGVNKIQFLLKLTNEILKKYRLDNGYSQQEMATKLSVSREFYNKIENDKLSISEGIELKFEKLLNSENVSHEINENNGSYLEKRRDLKNNSKSEGIIYVPVTAHRMIRLLNT